MRRSAVNYWRKHFREEVILQTSILSSRYQIILGLEDGKVNQSYGNISLGVGIRTVKGDQIGYGFTQELTEDSMMSSAATASTLCDMNASPVGSSFSRPMTGNYYPVAADFNGIPAEVKTAIDTGPQPEMLCTLA